MKMRALICCVVAGLLSGVVPVAYAETVNGRVAAIVDGDTLLVDVAGRGQWRVHLAWIAAPARQQPYGEAARSGLGAQAYGRDVQLDDPQPEGGEWRARVRVAPPGGHCSGVACPAGVDLGLRQIENGLAWHDRRRHGQPAPLVDAYRQAEFAAKIRRFGLWSGKNPSPPWEWRGPR